jgi:UDP-glucuronate decarboxylase
LPQDDPRQRQPNITKAHDFLGWKPITPLKEGLIKTIAYFDELLREPGIMEMLGESPKKKIQATEV